MAGYLLVVAIIAALIVQTVLVGLALRQFVGAMSDIAEVTHRTAEVCDGIIRAVSATVEGLHKEEEVPEREVVTLEVDES